MGDTPEAASNGDSIPESPPGGSPLAAIICASLGCAGWLSTLCLMGEYDDSEKLARFMQALFNVIILSSFGGFGALLSLVGLFLSRPGRNRSRGSLSQWAASVSWLGLGLGAIILIASLPAAWKHLN